LSTEFHVLVDFSWKLGKDVPKNIVDPSLEDWREPIRKLFEVDWQRKGQVSALLKPPEVEG
jgi:hypothetical protein